MWFDARAKLAEITGDPLATSATSATQAQNLHSVSQLSQVSQPPEAQKPRPALSTRADELKTGWAEIDTLPLLAEDRRFVRERIRGRRDAAALLARYAIRWRAAADVEPVGFRKANRGRFSANTWLLQATTPGTRNRYGTSSEPKK
jgi:hypothetical protein